MLVSLCRLNPGKRFLLRRYFLPGFASEPRACTIAINSAFEVVCVVYSLSPVANTEAPQGIVFTPLCRNTPNTAPQRFHGHACHFPGAVVLARKLSCREYKEQTRLTVASLGIQVARAKRGVAMSRG